MITVTQSRATTQRIVSDRTAAVFTDIVLLVAQPLLFFYSVLFNPKAHIPFDIQGFHLPLAAYIARCAREGTLPLWDPYQLCGVPIHADPQAQLFYPLTWISLLLGNLSAGHKLFYWIEWLVPLHMILAGLFTFYLLKQVGVARVPAYFGATVYQLGGFFASQAQHLGAVCCAAWLPVVALAVWKLSQEVNAKWIAVLAIGLALSTLSGFFATTLVVFIVAAMITAVLMLSVKTKTRFLAAIVGGYVLGAGIAAIQLIPTYQLAVRSVATERAQALGTGGGLKLQSLVSLFLPNFYNIFTPFDHAKYRVSANFTFLYVYCGLITLLLVLIAPLLRRCRYARWLFGFTVISAIWMLGDATPVYRLVFTHLPNMIRGALYAEFALLAFCFFAAVTAAVVLNYLGRGWPTWILYSIALVTAADLIHTGAGRIMNSFPGSYRLQESEYQLSGHPGALERIQSLAWQTNPPSRIDYVARDMSPLILGAGMMKVPTANGDNPFALRQIVYLRRLFGKGNWWERQVPVVRTDSPILKALNIGFVASRDGEALGAVGLDRLPTALEAGGMRLHQIADALPRFFLVRRVHVSTTPTETLAYLSRANFQPGEEADIEATGLAASELPGSGSVQIKRYSANRVELIVNMTGRSFLASSEVLYPGWTATVNGKSAPFYMTNGAFRGIFLNAGMNKVVMTYWPWSMVIGAILTVLSGGLAMVVLVSPYFGRKQARKPAMRALLMAAIDRARLYWHQYVVPRRSTIEYVLLLLLATVLFYWKILLTNQFSLLTEWEGVTQGYSWLRFWTSSIRHGVLPLWDPYTLAGHGFVGEMQTAVFYPLHLLLALAPPNQSAMLSPSVYHLWFAFTHFLAALFMFALVREFGLNRFSALLAGICFSFGGFVSRMQWPHMLESSIWLPLIFLFFLRAIRAGCTRGAIRSAVLGGLMLAMSALAGGLHVVIMQALVIGSAGLFYVLVCRAMAPARSWLRAAIVVATIGVVGFAGGAVQFLPSAEYGRHALRFMGKPGALPANEKITYDYMTDKLWPGSFVAMLAPQAFGGNLGGGEVTNPYLGVLPLILAILGLWKYWSAWRVRYLAALALAALLYSWGSFSWLHGVLYAVVPRLWMAREPSRIVYLLDFSVSILAGFGAEVLLSTAFQNGVWSYLVRPLKGLAAGSFAVLFVLALLGRPEINPWIAFSICMILLSCGLLWYIAAGHSGRAVRALIIGLVLFDLAAFDWTARNKMEVSRTGIDHLERLRSCRDAVQFLKSRTEPFRVEVAGEQAPNIGDQFGVPTTNSAGVTKPVAYSKIANRRDLLNVRYVLVPASMDKPGAVYQDPAWKVYENPTAAPRAWMVHKAIVENSPEAAVRRLDAAGFDYRRTGVVDRNIALEPLREGAVETVVFGTMRPNRIEVDVHTQSRALLILSETFYPGWHARVNSTPTPIYRADAGLRGVVVPAGDSRVVLQYRPWPVYVGGALTLAAFLGTFLGVRFWKDSPRDSAG